MARTLGQALSQVKATTARLASEKGVEGELIWDLTKKTWVGMDGVINGGHPMAKESRKIKGSDYVTIDGAAEGDLSVDRTVALVLDALAAALVSGDANNGLKIGDDDKLFASSPAASLIIDENEKLIKDKDGKLATDISLGYDATTGVVTVYDSSVVATRQAIATVTIPSHTSALQSAEITTTDGTNTGTFLHFVFLLTNGTTTDVYADVADLVDIYTNGDGLSLTGNQFAVKLAASGGLEFDTSKSIKVKIVDLLSKDAGNAMMVGSDDLIYFPLDLGTL